MPYSDYDYSSLDTVDLFGGSSNADLSFSNLAGNSSGASVAQPAAVAGDGTSGFFQSLASLGTGYLSKRLDVDLYSRLAGSQPMPQLRTTQSGIGGYGQVVTNPATGQKVAAINLSAVMPLLLVGAAVFFFARRG